MKKCFLLCCAVLAYLSSTAQNAPIDFEPTGNGASWTWTVFENDTNPELEIIDNPDPAGINTSTTVAKFTALQSGQAFAGCESQHGSDIGTFTLNSSTSTIKIMVWKSVISDVGIKLVEANSGSLGEIKVPNTVTDQWEELTFDFSAAEGIAYDQIVVFPDFTTRTMDNIVYFDNITFGDLPPLAAPMVAAPTPTIDPANVISMFSNAYTDVAVDTWHTPWSVASLSDLQIAGNDTKKYAGLDFVGIETVGPNLINASAMEYFHIDVWSPNITTFRIKLVDFGANGVFDGPGVADDTEHEIIFENQAQNTWVTYEIPLADFTGLTATSNIAQLILSALPAGESVIYVDNVYYSNLPTSVTEFETVKLEISPNPAQHNIFISTKEKIESLKIYNVLGELVLVKKETEHISSLEIAHLPRGTYFLVADLAGKRVVEQFVKN